MPAHRTLGLVERGLFITALLLIAWWLQVHEAADSYQSAAARRLAVELHARPGAAARPGGTAGADSTSTLGRIEIPRLHISAMIAQGTSAEVLDRAVGHVTSTAAPAEPGNVALAGHRDTFFRGLGGIHPNDLIRVVTPESTYAYAVEWTTIVTPQRVDLLDPTAARSLTLITCYPFHWVGPAPKRFVVRAVLADASAN